MRKDYMTVKGGVGPKDGDRIYRDLKGVPGIDIIYFEYKGFLFRQILEQDVALVKEANRLESQNYQMLVRDKRTGNYEVMSADKVYAAPTDEEILQRIRGINANDEGKVSLAVFVAKTKEFVAILDVETLEDSEYTECAVEFLFSNNKVTRKRYENNVKKYFIDACKETGFFVNGGKEKINHGDHYELREIIA